MKQVSYQSLLHSLKTISVHNYLAVVTVFYIFWQISLSGAILSVQTESQAQNLNLLAKFTVGFGSSLFAFRILYLKQKLYLVLLASLFIGYSVMQLEDLFIDHLASKTTTEERLEAKQILVFNIAQISEKVVLSDLPDSITQDHVRLKTFAKILAFSIWQDPKLISEITNKVPEIVNALYGQEAYNRIDREYDNYVKMYKKHINEYIHVQQSIERMDFARASHLLNSQLARYATCNTDKCRKTVTDQVNLFLEKTIPDLPVSIDLESFCKHETVSERYVLGQAVSSTVEKKCAVSEHGLFQLVQNEANLIRDNFLLDANIPPDLIPFLVSEKMLSLEDWRELLKEFTANEIQNKIKEEFFTSIHYEKNGIKEAEGKNYAIAIFIPPVALGISLIVCFLNFTTLLISLTNKPKICSSVVITICLLPAFLDSHVPFDGFIAKYANWLIFWQDLFYPLGIFRNIIL